MFGKQKRKSRTRGVADKYQKSFLQFPKMWENKQPVQEKQKSKAKGGKSKQDVQKQKKIKSEKDKTETIENLKQKEHESIDERNDW